MVSGSSPADALAEQVRATAVAAADLSDVRFDRGEERPLGTKGRRTRRAILVGATAAFAELGWSGTTIGAIAARAGVGAGTLYQYFRSKSDVLTALVGEWTLAALGQLRAWDPGAGRDGLQALVGRFVAGYAATARLQAVWEEASLVEPELAALRHDLAEVYVRLFADAFAAGAADGLLDAGPEPIETARALCAMVDRYCHLVFVQAPGMTTPATATDLLTGLWSAALGLR